MANGDGSSFGDKLVNANKMGFSLPVLVTLFGVSFSGAWWINDKIGELKLEITQNSAGIARNTVNPRHAWRRWDMSLWCARVEKANPTFKCPDAYGQPSARGGRGIGRPN